MLQVDGCALRIEAAGAAADGARVVSKGPVLSAASDLCGLRVDRHHAAAREWPNVRASSLIESEVPCSNGAAPVAEYSAESSAPLAPISQIPRICIVRTAFRPVHLSLRLSILDLCHHLGSAVVAVPGNGIGVAAELCVGQHADRAAPQIIVMVQQPDLE